MRILSILGGEKGVAVFHYRVKNPLTRLATKHHVMWTHFDRLGEIETVPDLVILNRPVADDSQREWIRDTFIKSLRSVGATIVLETDDDYITGKGKTSLPYLDHIDAVTVASHGLKKLYSQYTDKPIHVLPNSIDIEWFSDVSMKAAREDDRLTVGLIGTNSHYDDWHIMTGVIQELKSDDIRFTCVGLHPDYMNGVAEFVSGAPYPKYPELLRQIDILCCPLSPDKAFNDSKSYVKAIEGWGAARKLDNGKVGGCLVLASDHAVYRNTVQHNHNGLLVKYTEDAWIQAISRMIEQKVQRLKFQAEGYRDVKVHHDIERNYKAWGKAYTSIRRNHIEGGSK